MATLHSTAAHPSAPTEPCPLCGKPPVVAKAGVYWQARCTTTHRQFVASHRMLTRRAALEEWNLLCRTLRDADAAGSKQE
ncbi:MAG TPA: hypothetical protein VF457_08715 [Burkholderiaceae bacterium]